MKFGGYTNYTTPVIKNGLSRLEALYMYSICAYMYVCGQKLCVINMSEFVLFVYAYKPKLNSQSFFYH